MPAQDGDGVARALYRTEQGLGGSHAARRPFEITEIEVERHPGAVSAHLRRLSPVRDLARAIRRRRRRPRTSGEGCPSRASAAVPSSAIARRPGAAGPCTVMGIDTSIPTGPSSHTAKKNIRNTSHVARDSARPVHAGSRTFSATRLSMTPPTSRTGADARAGLRERQQGWRDEREGEAEIGHEAQEEGPDAPQQGIVHAEHEHQREQPERGDGVDANPHAEVRDGRIARRRRDSGRPGSGCPGLARSASRAVGRRAAAARRR